MTHRWNVHLSVPETAPRSAARAATRSETDGECRRGGHGITCVCVRARAFERHGVRRNDTKSTRREFVRISIWESQVTSSYRYDKREKEEDDSAWTRTKRTFSNTSAHSSSSPLACPTWSLGDAKMGFHCPADRTNRLRKSAAGATTSTVSPTSTTPEP